jgi:hypothetical protein
MSGASYAVGRSPRVAVCNRIEHISEQHPLNVAAGVFHYGRIQKIEVAPLLFGERCDNSVQRPWEDRN